MIAQTIITFLRGLVLTFPIIIIGILIAAYVPSYLIASGTGVLLVIVIFVSGSLLDTPGQMWRKWKENRRQQKNWWP